VTARTRILLALGAAALMFLGALPPSPEAQEAAIHARIEELAPLAVGEEAESALLAARDYIDRGLIPEAIEATVELEEACHVRNR